MQLAALEGGGADEQVLAVVGQQPSERLEVHPGILSAEPVGPPFWHSLPVSASFRTGTLALRVPVLATECDPRDGVPPSKPQRRGATVLRTQSQQVEKVEVGNVSVNIKPLEDRIVVKPLDAEQTTASGLVIPDTAKEKPQEGEVVAVGPGRFDEDGDDRVPHGRFRR